VHCGWIPALKGVYRSKSGDALPHHSFRVPRDPGTIGQSDVGNPYVRSVDFSICGLGRKDQQARCSQPSAGGRRRSSSGFSSSNYPPAKPGALVCEPLKAAAGSLARPRKTTRDSDILICYGALPKLPGHPPCFPAREVSRNPAVGTRRQRRRPSRSSMRIITNTATAYCDCGVCQTSTASPAEPGGLPTD
jgi:hypothetical protein